MLMINDIMFTSKEMADFTHDLARALEATIDSNKNKIWLQKEQLERQLKLSL